MFSLPDVAPVTRVVNRGDVFWDPDNRVFTARDATLDWRGEPVVLVSPKTGETIRFDSLEIRLRLHADDIDAWVLRGSDHPWELIVQTDEE
jgi:hypothetical protein